MNIINIATYFIFLGFLLSLSLLSSEYLVDKFHPDDGEAKNPFSLNNVFKKTFLVAYMIFVGSFALMLSLTSLVAVIDADKDEFWFPVFVEILLESWGLV